MIEWTRCAERLPEDGQMCLIYGEVVNVVVGPVLFKLDMTQRHGWVDLWTTREAGTVYYADGEGAPSHWAPWNGPADVNEEGEES